MADFTWKTGAIGDWSDADNWQNGAVPTAMDSVTVPSFASEVHVTTSISCASIDNSGSIFFLHAGPANISSDVYNRTYEIYITGTDVTIGGTLFNLTGQGGDHYVDLTSDNSAAARLTVGAIDNTGILSVGGKRQCTLDVQGPASFGTAGTVTGDIRVGRAGLIEFSGTDQITTIAGGAFLGLTAADAFIADAGIDDASNSALTDLRNIDGGLQIIEGAEVDTGGGMVVGTGGSISLGKRQTAHGSGTLTMQGTLVNQGTITGIGGAVLGIGGNLVNEGVLSMSVAPSRVDVAGAVRSEDAIDLERGATMDVAGNMTVTSGGTVTLTTRADLAVHGSLLNEGSMTFGNQKADETQGLLNVDGTVVNDGTMTFYGGPEEFAGAVKGDGRFSLGLDATLTFDDAVGRNAQFVLSHRDVLELADPADFHASVQKFGANDAYLIDGFDAKTKYDFVSNAAGTGGYLNVSDGAMGSAQIHMKGAYDTSDFVLTSDTHGVRISSTA